MDKTQFGALQRSVAFVTTIVFVFSLFAADLIGINNSARAVSIIPGPKEFIHTSESYSFPVLRGLRLNPDNPFDIEFIVDVSDKEEVTRREASRLISYFLAGLTIPENNLWVNLSPYEKNRIVPLKLGETDLGKDLLGQDYVLKQITASLTYPENSIGRNYWDKTYSRLKKIVGSAKVPVNTFNKVWIVPEDSLVYENNNTAMVLEADLKAMLEEDYAAMEKSNIQQVGLSSNGNNSKINKVASEVMKEEVIPEINREINRGKNFARLRQIYHSLILATWFKKKFKESVYQHYIDRNKVKGIDIPDKEIKDKIYRKYIKAYQEGLYDYIKKDYDRSSRQYIKRRYYSGGASFGRIGDSMDTTPSWVLAKTYVDTGDLRSIPTEVNVISGEDFHSSSSSSVKSTVSFGSEEEVVLSRRDKRVEVKYGTSGWRAKRKEFTVDNAGRAVKGIAQELNSRVASGELRPRNNKNLKVLVAYDAREGGVDFAKRGVEVLSAYGIKADISKNLSTTPGVIAMTRENLGSEGYDLALHFTASHNDASHMGLKILESGVVAPDSLTKRFAQRANDAENKKGYKRIPWDNLEVNQVNIKEEVLQRYRNVFPDIIEKGSDLLEGKSSNFLTVDLMHGSAIPFIDQFKQMGAKIVRNTPMSDSGYPQHKFFIGGEEKPYRPEPVWDLLSPGASEDFSQNAPDGAMYVAIDGDGDRVACWVKKDGEVVELTPNNLGILYGWYLIKTGKVGQGKVIAKTLPTTYGMNKLVQWANEKMGLNIKLEKTPVGSKYFAPFMKDSSKNKAIIATEESGHQGFTIGGETLFDDAASQALFLIDMMAESGKDLATLFNEAREEIGFQGVYKRTNKDLNEELKSQITTPLKQDPQGLAKKIIESVGKDVESVSVTTADEDVYSVDADNLDKINEQELKINEGMHIQFKDNSWTQIRLSGTEPVARVYTEAKTEEDRQALEDAVSRALNIPVKSGGESGDSKVAKLIGKFLNHDFIDNLKSLYGLTRKEAEKVNPYLTKIMFDGEDNRAGWTTEHLEWILNNKQEGLSSVLEEAAYIRENYKNVIFCGMGGSGLSVETVKETFGKNSSINVYGLRTTDPTAIKNILDEIADVESTGIITEQEENLKRALQETLIIPISKSGTTAETISHKEYSQNIYSELELDIRNNMWALTDATSDDKKPINSNVDANNRYKIQLNGKEDIGGRYSAPTTRIFLLPLAILAPEKVEEILETALKMNNIEDARKDPFLNLAAFLYHNAYQVGRDKLTLILPEKFKALGPWFEQLLEESLGKDGKGISLFYGENLTEDNILSYMDPKRNSRVFLKVNLGEGKEDIEWTDSEHFDTLISQYPIFKINLENKDSIAGLMLGLQRTVSGIAYLWNISAVDQPSVEGYKKATKKVMAESGSSVDVPYEWKSSLSFEWKDGSERYDGSNKSGVTLYNAPLLETDVLSNSDDFLNLLREEVSKINRDISNPAASLAAVLNLFKNNPSYGVEAVELITYGQASPDVEENLQEVRTDIFTDRLEMPSKLGQGPDKNYSYHQNIEGGKDQWLSIYVLPLSFEQPMLQNYDEKLLKAQAIGTVKSLIARGRKVMFITYDGSLNRAGPLLSFFQAVDNNLSELQLAGPNKGKYKGQKFGVDTSEVEFTFANSEWDTPLSETPYFDLAGIDESSSSAVTSGGSMSAYGYSNPGGIDLKGIDVDSRVGSNPVSMQMADVEDFQGLSFKIIAIRKFTAQ